MLKRNIELIKNGERQALLMWHHPDGEGGMIPIAMEFADGVDEEMRQRIIEMCKRPVSLRDKGVTTKAFSGSSKHFLGLPKVLARLGFRTRLF